MANTLTGLIPTIYKALDTVSREMTGFVPAVRRDSGVEYAAKGQTVSYPIVPQGELEDIVPGADPAASGSQAIGVGSTNISKSQAYAIVWNGEETLSLSNGVDPQYNNIISDQFAQAFRTFGNQLDADLFSLYVQASNAYGTAANTPFATANDLTDFAGSRMILEDNGSPTSALQMVLGSAAIANIRGVQSGLFKVNEAGTSELLRNGAIGNVEGFMVHNSAQVSTHTNGTGTSYTSATTGFAIGTTSIPIITGTGTVLAGDVVTFAGDDTKYVVTTGVAAPGTIEIAEPGLKIALAASAVAMTIGGDYTPNMVFDRNAMILATRFPAAPEGGDSADDVMAVTDPITGISYEIRMYRQYRQVKIEVGLAWGYDVVKPAHVGILLG